MNNFLFKSDNRLIKNSSVDLDSLMKKMMLALAEQRHQRSDLQDIKRMINRLLIDEHLQQQVDKYFDEDQGEQQEPPELEDK